VLEAQPLDRVAGIDVDDLQPAAGDRVLGGEPFVERESLEGAVAARPPDPFSSLLHSERLLS
jgi:hypothetical protein